MLDYWGHVLARAWTESWALVTGLDTPVRFAVLAAPFVVGALIFLRLRGWKSLKDDYIIPALILAGGYVVCAFLLFAVNVVRVPSILQQEIEAAGFASMEARHAAVMMRAPLGN